MSEERDPHEADKSHLDGQMLPFGNVPQSVGHVGPRASAVVVNARMLTPDELQQLRRNAAADAIDDAVERDPNEGRARGRGAQEPPEPAGATDDAAAPRTPGDGRTAPAPGRLAALAEAERRRGR